MDQHERFYRKVIGSIGMTMLLFLLLLNLFAVSTTMVDLLFSTLFSSAALSYTFSKIYYALGYLACFMLPVILLRALIGKGGYPYQPMESNLRLTPWIFLIIPAGITVVYASAQLNAYMVSIFNYSDFISDIMGGGEAQQFHGYHWVLEFLVICLVPGFCEEFLFRGAIQTNLRPFGRSRAILISALLFCLMHQNAGQTLYTFVAGIFLGVVYEMTKSIWASTLLHVCNNFASVLETMILHKENTVFEATAAIGMFEAVLFAFGVVSLVILLLRFFGKRDDLREGFFGKELEAADGYTVAPISTKRAIRLFWTPSMTAFIVICLLEIGALLLLSLVFKNVPLPI